MLVGSQMEPVGGNQMEHSSLASGEADYLWHRVVVGIEQKSTCREDMLQFGYAQS